MDYWQKDYNDNLVRLEKLNTPFNKFKMMFSKDLKEEYEKPSKIFPMIKNSSRSLMLLTEMVL